MEAAYDHIQEEVLKADPKAQAAAAEGDRKDDAGAPPESNLNTDLQDAYRSFSSSAWGVRLGGFLGSVRRQGESYYQSARDEASIASEEALKGFTDLRSTIVSRARGLSLGETEAPPAAAAAASRDADQDAKSAPSTATASEEKTAPVEGTTPKSDDAADDPTADGDGFISRFRAEAGQRLQEIRRAEDAADEALLKFGTNLRNFLREAVTIAPPTYDDEDDPFADGSAPKGDNKGGKSGGGSGGGGKVLFESKDAEGRRVIHTTRFDAQLHVIHCALDSFTKDPASPEWTPWRETFDVTSKTDAIAADLEKYEELRRAMERLVPEKVEYTAFWARYYFLRMVVASEEQRRKEMLKGAAMGTEEEVGWDEDSDEEPTTPQATEPSDAPDAAAAVTPKPAAVGAAAAAAAAGGLTVKPSAPRTSQDENSNPGSDESYDLVSGAPSSRGPGSPRDGKEKGAEKAKEAGPSAPKRDESDEEDWE